MVWMVEKKVIYHYLDLGFERVKVPVLVTFEFEIREGSLVPETLSRSILFNRPLLERRYPDLDTAGLEGSIEEKVDRELDTYLRACGWLKEEPE
jgi:hypothetical protein